MPAAFWIPLQRDPGHVQGEHLHGAVSRLLDHTTAEHHAHKPYACSPPVIRNDALGLVLSSLTEAMSSRVEEVFIHQPVLRLGDHLVPAGPAEPLAQNSWADLASAAEEDLWRLDLLSPTMRRRNSRVSALPEPYSLCRGLLQRWTRWADIEHPHPIDQQRYRAILVTDLALRSESASWGSFQTRAKGKDYVVTGARGFMEWLLPDSDLVAAVTPLLRLAPYSGLGSYTNRGFGYCSVRPVPRG